VPEFDGPYDRHQVDLLWALRASTDSRIEPIAVGERRWREDDAGTSSRRNKFPFRSWKSRGGRDRPAHRRRGEAAPGHRSHNYAADVTL